MKTIDQRLEAIEKSLEVAGLATKKVLNFSEAVKFLGISESFLYKLTSGQNVPHYKIGKLCYFNREELETWVQQNRIATCDEIAMKAQNYCMKNGLKK